MKKKSKTRENIIRATSKLVALRGFHRTSLQEILDESGVGKGAFYHHFESKEVLGLAVLEQHRISLMDMMDSCFRGKRGIEALECFLRKAFEKHSSVGFAGGCIWGNTAIEMSDCNPKYVKFVDQVFREWIGRLSKVIAEGQEDGKIRTDISASDLAMLIVEILEGGIMLSRLRKEKKEIETGIELFKLLLSDKTIQTTGER